MSVTKVEPAASSTDFWLVNLNLPPSQLLNYFTCWLAVTFEMTKQDEVTQKYMTFKRFFSWKWTKLPGFFTVKLDINIILKIFLYWLFITVEFLPGVSHIFLFSIKSLPYILFLLLFIELSRPNSAQKRILELGIKMSIVW